MINEIRIMKRMIPSRIWSSWRLITSLAVALLRRSTSSGLSTLIFHWFISTLWLTGHKVPKPNTSWERGKGWSCLRRCKDGWLRIPLAIAHEPSNCSRAYYVIALRSFSSETTSFLFQSSCILTHGVPNLRIASFMPSRVESIKQQVLFKINAIVIMKCLIFF